MSQFDCNKRLKLMEALQYRRFYVKMECLLLWPTYIGEKGRTLGKTYGIKVRCYWEHPWGAHWKPDGNTLGPRRDTCWEHPTQNPKEKKNKALWVHAEPSHWLHEISISKTICHHFLPGLIPPLEIGGTYIYTYVVCNILKWFVECEPFGEKNV
jgi:hypothetical protein